MATVEVYTIGGGDYVVNIFNAVAAWTGAGGYKSMIQTVLVMAFAMSTMLVAFNQDWKAWIHWFLQATLMYLCLMVPRMDVQVVDRINPGLPAAHVANVPIGLAMMASFTSQIGDYMVRSSELVFGLPDDLNYSRNGMIYGSRLLEATNGLSINDAEFAANLDEHYRLCVFYDVMLGRKSMEQLKNADDLWAVLGPASEARSQKFLTRDAGGNVTSDIISCREAYTRLSDDWTRMLDELAKVFGKQLYPKEVPDLARAKLFADLPIAYEYLAGVSKDASEIMKQTLAINAMSQAMHSFSGSTGVSSVDVYAQTRAEIQTRNTYNSIAHNAMKWVPILNIVLTVVFYALFPIIFPLFLLPRTGPHALKGYVTGFFYLAAWGPLYVILHMVMMLKSHTDVAGAAVGGVTLASWNGVQAVNADVGILAGYLVASIPFLAAGMARGAMAISGHATSYLSPSQNAAEEAAREASTGNLSFGNTSFDNASYNNRQGNVWASAANYSSGYGGIHGFNADGTSTGYYPESTVVDQSKGISRLAVTPTLASDLQSSFTTNASREHSVARTTAQEASSAVSAANTQSVDLRKATSSSKVVSDNYGAGDAQTINRANSQMASASDDMAKTLGVSRQVADNWTSEWFNTGQIRGGMDASVGVEALGNGVTFNGGYGAAQGRKIGEGEHASAGADDRLSKARTFLEQRSSTENWSDNREAYHRASVATNNESLRSLARSSQASYTQSATLSHSARIAEERAQRFSEAAQWRESNGVTVSENLSQPFVNFVLAEQERNAAVGLSPGDWNPTRGAAVTDQEKAEEAVYIKKFIESRVEAIRNGVADDLVDVAPAGITGPAVSSQADVRALADHSMSRIAGNRMGSGAETVANIMTDRSDIQDGVISGTASVETRLQSRERVLRKPTDAIERNPGQTIQKLRRDRDED
jgi:conjugal transfer mating pair stabilization protein TraG